jgi:cystathionine gamma-lyase
MAFSSGLAAMDCVLHQLRAGDHVVLSDDVYGGTFRQLDKVFRTWASSDARGHDDNLSNGENAMRPTTRLVWLETPSNPMLKVIDIAACARSWTGSEPKGAKAGGRSRHGAGPAGHADREARSCSWTTRSHRPTLQNPLSQGAHIVMHSCTKYIGGHSDLVAGALMTSDDALADRLKYVQNAVGAVPGAMDCFLMLRSTKTLHVRMQRHCENAMKIARGWRSTRRSRR